MIGGRRGYVEKEGLASKRNHRIAFGHGPHRGAVSRCEENASLATRGKQDLRAHRPLAFRIATCRGICRGPLRRMTAFAHGIDWLAGFLAGSRGEAEFAFAQSRNVHLNERSRDSSPINATWRHREVACGV